MKVFKLKENNFKKAVRQSAALIRQGKIIACPTDTVYGFVCDAGSKKAMNRLYRIKKRPKSKLFPVFVKDINMAKEMAEIDERQESFLRNVWPGALTAVLESKKGGGTIGLRIPKNKFILDLIEETNRPLAETSVNVSGKKPLNSANEIIKRFGKEKNRPDLILDAGILKKKPSKVMDLTRNFKVLRK